MSSKWLLVTDVDDTLLGSDAALDRLAARLATTDVSVVLNSSRPVASVLAGAEPWIHRLPIQGVIGALGTEIMIGGAMVTAWSATFADFPRAAIATVLDRHGMPHASEYQTAAKVSYDVAPAGWRQCRDDIAAVDPALRIITSGAASFDVIPADAGKAAATRYVAALIGVPTERLVTSGDSENDADLLSVGNGVMVGNATVGLRRLVPPSVYAAERFHADGIVEGLEQYGAVTRAPSSPDL